MERRLVAVVFFAAFPRIRVKGCRPMRTPGALGGALFVFVGASARVGGHRRPLMQALRLTSAGIRGLSSMGFKGSRVRIPPSRPSLESIAYGCFGGPRKGAVLLEPLHRPSTAFRGEQRQGVGPVPAFLPTCGLRRPVEVTRFPPAMSSTMEVVRANGAGQRLRPELVRA